MSPYAHEAAFDEGFMQVSDLHQVYYSQYGKKGGKPVIFLHGGPGGSAAFKETRFFDPAVYHVILMDQRGAGRSRPVAELRDNTTQHLIADLEQLREKVGVSKWHLVFGGSWGSTLALAYAQSHPEVVGSLILRGVFLGQQWEFDWTLRGQGTANLYPQEWEDFIAYLPEDQRDDPVKHFYKHLTSGDQDQTLAASKVWNRWEMSVSFLSGTPANVKEEMLANVDWNLQHARIETHYFVHDCFLAGDKLLTHPANIARMADIPTYIVQGRYDVVCPPKAAWMLHTALPKSELYWSQHAGHASTEPETQAKLIELCDRVGAA